MIFGVAPAGGVRADDPHVGNALAHVRDSGTRSRGAIGTPPSDSVPAAVERSSTSGESGRDGTGSAPLIPAEFPAELPLVPEVRPLAARTAATTRGKSWIGVETLTPPVDSSRSPGRRRPLDSPVPLPVWRLFEEDARLEPPAGALAFGNVEALARIAPPRRSELATALSRVVRKKYESEVRRFLKRRWRNEFEATPTMSYAHYLEGVFRINQLGRDPLDYDYGSSRHLANEFKEGVFGREGREGERDFEILGWGPIVVMDSGSVRFDLGRWVQLDRTPDEAPSSAVISASAASRAAVASDPTARSGSVASARSDPGTETAAAGDGGPAVGGPRPGGDSAATSRATEVERSIVDSTPIFVTRDYRIGTSLRFGFDPLEAIDRLDPSWIVDRYGVAVEVSWLSDVLGRETSATAFEFEIHRDGEFAAFVNLVFRSR